MSKIKPMAKTVTTTINHMVLDSTFVDSSALFSDSAALPDSVTVCKYCDSERIVHPVKLTCDPLPNQKQNKQQQTNRCTFKRFRKTESCVAAFTLDTDYSLSRGLSNRYVVFSYLLFVNLITVKNNVYYYHYFQMTLIKQAVEQPQRMHAIRITQLSISFKLISIFKNMKYNDNVTNFLFHNWSDNNLNYIAFVNLLAELVGITFSILFCIGIDSSYIVAHTGTQKWSNYVHKNSKYFVQILLPV